MNEIWTLDDSPGPIVATAIHAGSDLRPQVRRAIALDEAGRFREEDPFTDAWTVVGDARLVATHSRFEVDLNRPRDQAVYRTPEDAWGLDVWQSPPSSALVEDSLAEYDAFYHALRALVERRIEACGTVLVLDLHSYNHQRGGPGAAFDDPTANPDVNVGTGSMDRARWAPLVDAFIAGMCRDHPDYGALDARENVKFRGGYMSRWLHATFPEQVCAIAIEVKKIFMDEWSGVLDADRHRQIGETLATTVVTLRDILGR